VAEADMTNGDKKYWLDRPGSGGKVFWVLCMACALLFVADAFYEKHPSFAVEAWFGFYAIFGIVFCAGLVLLARKLRWVLMRKEDYYD
jgi:hypothetical protein